MTEDIRPAHYGGEDNAYEVIKVLRAWDLELAKGFCWGNVIKYTARADKKDRLADRIKAKWYANELLSIEKELAQRVKKATPVTRVMVTPSSHVVINWDKQSFEIQHSHAGVGGSGGTGAAASSFGGGGGGGVYANGGSGATMPRCNSSYGCVHGNHGRSCPMRKDVW